MNELAFADAAATRPVVVLRTRLEPFSIGHEILLHKQRNDLVLLSEVEFSKLPDEQKRVAVIRAVLICCQNWGQNKKTHRWLWLWYRRIRKENFSLAITDFRNYRHEGSTFPQFRLKDHFKDDVDGRELGGPFLCRLLHFVRDDFDYPMGFAQWKYFCSLEEGNRCHIENPMEKQVRDEIEYHREEVRKEKEAERANA